MDIGNDWLGYKKKFIHKGRCRPKMAEDCLTDSGPRLGLIRICTDKNELMQNSRTN